MKTAPKILTRERVLKLRWKTWGIGATSTVKLPAQPIAEDYRPDCEAARTRLGSAAPALLAANEPAPSGLIRLAFSLQLSCQSHRRTRKTWPSGSMERGKNRDDVGGELSRRSPGVAGASPTQPPPPKPHIGYPPGRAYVPMSWPSA